MTNELRRIEWFDRLTMSEWFGWHMNVGVGAGF
jgi:hypothetical protein